MYYATQKHTQIGIPLLYTPYVYWKMVAYQNVTPGFISLFFFQRTLVSILHEGRLVNK